LNQDQPELIVQLQQGSESAFRKLVDEYEGMVYNTAIGIVQNEEDADDVTQEVFIQVYQSIHSFKGESKLSTWLYRIAVTKALDHEKRKKRKKRFAFLESLFGHAKEEIIHPADFQHPGIVLENKEKAGELFNALKQLPDNQRIAFTLHKLEGISYQEIADIMEITLSAVESLMGRAKNNLQKILRTYYLQKEHK
jgi:RNA polymerase sigma factor (sigma-70 family)